MKKTNTKQRLFEMMGKINPDFKNKLNETTDSETPSTRGIRSGESRVKKMFFDYTLDGHEATEENAYDAARGLDWQEIETSEGDYPYLNYVDTVNGVGIWYNYGHDAYYFSDETISEESLNNNEEYNKNTDEGLNYIVVLPYHETNRLFHVSKETKQNAYLGPNDEIVYYENEAMKFSKEEAEKKVASSKNDMAHIKKIDKQNENLTPDKPIKSDQEGVNLNIGDVVTVDGLIGEYQIGTKSFERKPFLMPFDMVNKKPIQTHIIYLTSLNNPKMNKVLSFSDTEGGFMNENTIENSYEKINLSNYTIKPNDLVVIAEEIFNSIDTHYLNILNKDDPGRVESFNVNLGNDFTSVPLFVNDDEIQPIMNIDINEVVGSVLLSVDHEEGQKGSDDVEPIRGYWEGMIKLQKLSFIDHKNEVVCEIPPNSRIFKFISSEIEEHAEKNFTNFK